MRAVTLADLVDLVLPRCCVGCGRAGYVLCSACTPTGVRRVDAAGLPVLAAGGYAGALRAALIVYKERGRRDLAGPLGGLLGRAVTEGPAGLLIPVPSAARIARARGGDHVLRLARVAARVGAARIATPLRLARPVRDSAGLGLLARAANLGGAMTADPPPRPGAAAVIVDDIVTTGATLAEAARARSKPPVGRFAAPPSSPSRRGAGTRHPPMARPGRPVYREVDLTE